MSKYPLILIVVGSTMSLIGTMGTLLNNHIDSKMEQAVEQYKQEHALECGDQ